MVVVVLLCLCVINRVLPFHPFTLFVTFSFVAIFFTSSSSSPLFYYIWVVAIKFWGCYILTVIVPVCVCKGFTFISLFLCFFFYTFFFSLCFHVVHHYYYYQKKITAGKYDDDLLEKILSVTSKAHKTWY